MTAKLDLAKLREAVAVRPPSAALVLGSGLGPLLDAIEPYHVWSFAELPELVPTTVPGHQGKLIHGRWAGRDVLAFSGRLHFYEGHGWETATAPVRLAAALGARIMVLTNAAGGIRDDLDIGALMALQHHVLWTEPYCWRRGINRSDPLWYADRLLTQLFQAAQREGIDLKRGIYGAVTGPSYETPAEIRAMRAMGIDAAGMSTAKEAQAAVALGMEVAAVSCITNRGAGLSTTPPHHAEVIANSKRAAERLGRLLASFVGHLA
jgi:purine-nucleoside phosphorylase